MSEERIPTTDELRHLPRRARAAYAARCARRVQPLFGNHLPEVDSKQVEAVEHAIRCAEEYAAGGGASVMPAASIAAAADDTARASASCRDAYSAAHAASLAARTVADDDDAVSAAEAAAWAADAAGVALLAADSTTKAMWYDFSRLISAATEEKWTDKTPVPHSFFGPWWPTGKPSGWPQ